MIASLNGVVAEKLPDIVIIDVQGVGYGLFVPTEAYGTLATGQTVKMYIYEHIREQQHDLFGFRTLDSKHLFEQLLSVNGVGPKMALNVMNIGIAGQVRAAIANGDLKFIQQADGVGKRVAERIVVELKDKVGLPGVALSDMRLPRHSLLSAIHHRTPHGLCNKLTYRCQPRSAFDRLSGCPNVGTFY
jgi:holliday junction DNA helicase RuvA